MGSDEGFNEWKKNNNVKDCPKCGNSIEKSGGCNHMLCKCGAHICWICLKVFPDDSDTYNHLGADHGGAYDRGHFVEDDENNGGWW